MSKELTLTMTIDQARACNEALELYSRVCIGQIDRIEDLVRMGVIPLGGERSERKEASMETCNAVESILKSVKVVLGYTANGSSGIGNPHVHITAHRTWEMKKVISKALAEDRNPNAAHRGVDYDGLSVRCTTDPAPVAVVIDRSSASQK